MPISALPACDRPALPNLANPARNDGCVWNCKLLADVGLIGLPNAGKTTLLTKLTASKAEASPYPFSTLEPNLGVLQHEEHDPIVVADIPGLIEGAHQRQRTGATLSAGT